VSNTLTHAAPGDAVSLSATHLLAFRRTRLSIAGAGIALGLGGLVLVATSDHLLHPTAYGIALANLVIGTTLVAVYWARRRPGNRIAVLLLGVALAGAFLSLQGASDPLLHSIGVLFDPVLFVLAYVAVFSFPGGRLSSLVDQLLTAAMAVVVLAAFLPWFFFSPVVAGGNPLAGCNAKCPENALMIADRPGVAGGLGQAEEYGATIVAAAIAVVFIWRLVVARRPRRRAAFPVYLPTLLLTVPFSFFHAYNAGLISLTAPQAWRLGWVVNAGRGTLAYGFALAIVQADLAAGGVFKRLMGRLSAGATVSELREVTTKVLDDPTLDLAFRAGHSAGYVDSRGDAFDPAHVNAARSATPVLEDGRAVAYVVHDPELAADPELLGAAGRALLLALESGRLERELELKTSELVVSNARAAAAGEAERRRIEQDLHDGAQQHLIALRVKMELARDLAAEDPRLADRLGALGEELEDVLRELRELAHGDYPPLLRDGGLAQALGTVARRSAHQVELDADGVGRYSPEVESAVYFCCLEALQNVGKHAGADATARLRLWTADEHVWFEIADDGAGCDPDRIARGNGLANMNERVAALEGTVAVESARGRGTTVRGYVAAEAA
jgi:signal transduction histidine kinase